MIISRVQVDRVLRAYLESLHHPREPVAARSPESRDRVQLSADAQRIAEFVRLARQLPEVRPERVAELRRALQSGRYRVDPEAVAAKMLERLLADAAASEVGA